MKNIYVRAFIELLLLLVIIVVVFAIIVGLICLYDYLYTKHYFRTLVVILTGSFGITFLYFKILEDIRKRDREKEKFKQGL